MATVDELRNEIRQSVGRFEREVSSGFTKEALAAVCAAVGEDVDANDYPSKPVMRAGILYRVGETDERRPEEMDHSFRKGELQAIADALAAE